MEYYILDRNTEMDWRYLSSASIRENQTLTADRGECLPFQILIYHSGEPVILKEVRFGALKGENTACDLEGHGVPVLEHCDCKGKFTRHSLKIDGNTVVWAYVRIPETMEPGAYLLPVSLLAEDMPEQTLQVPIEVSNCCVENHGVNDNDRMSRIQWFNSSLAIDDRIPQPFIPPEWDGGKRKVRLLGREMLFGENGLPAEISTYFDCQNLLCEQANPILKEAMRFTVQTGETTENFRVNSYHGECDDAACRVMAESESEHFTLTVSGSTEYDGYGFFDLALTAKQDIKVQDAFLSVAFTEAASKYFVGLGRQGGKFTEPLDFHWDTANHQDSFWMGNVNFGLRMQFQDENYVKPNVNIYYCYKPLRIPDSWGGEGKGGIRIDRGIARAYSGSYHAKKGETRHFCFRILITPLKPIDYRAQFTDRYYQSYNRRTEEAWLEDLKENHCNILNNHHGTDLIPYINYPFYESAAMKRFADQLHAENIRYKIYYTVRELTTKAKEFPILRSLGYEILEPSKGIEGATLWQGEAKEWIREYYGADIIPAWRETITSSIRKGEVDSAVLTNGESRLCNFYIEGLNWLVEHCGIDGIYVDDTAYDRETMKRVRKVLDQKEGALIDLHSWNHFTPRAGMTNSLNLYSELLPYIDKVWIGEGFDYENTTPDYWLVEMSGMIYGLMGDMLQNGGNFYRGLIFGETSRCGWSGTPQPAWQIWDRFGIDDSRMISYWNPDNPFVTTHPDILTTCYDKQGETLVCIASWADGDEKVRLRNRLGRKIKKIEIPEMDGYQTAQQMQPEDELIIAKQSGRVLFVEWE